MSIYETGCLKNALHFKMKRGSKKPGQVIKEMDRRARNKLKDSQDGGGNCVVYFQRKKKNCCLFIVNWEILLAKLNDRKFIINVFFSVNKQDYCLLYFFG